jgi:hypothetical protein
MKHHSQDLRLPPQGREIPPCSSADAAPFDLSRRAFLGRTGTVALLGAWAWLEAWPARAVPSGVVAGIPLPTGRPLQVKPVLLYHLDQRREKTSWRSYGGLKTPADVDRECERIGQELQVLVSQAEFPLQIEPLSRVNSDADAQAAAKIKADVLLVFGASGAQTWLELLAASDKPNLLFVRHRSGPVYLWYEIAHWRLLRKSEDVKAEPNLDFDDVVVDEYADVLWRLRALYGLKNARGTRMLALGGTEHYSRPAQERAPAHARDVWGYEMIVVPPEDLRPRIARVRSEAAAVREAERLADELIALPNVVLETDRRFVVNTFLALRVIRELMEEHQCTNLGVAHCMGGLIPVLDTPPCLALSLLNDAGLTAFCHTDFTHTLPGVLLRWLSNKPSFVCNSHFPHHGLLTLAHCAAPRKMNGRDFEPTTLLTHYESDYGAATKVEYRRGQVITCLIPNLRCTKWFGFRARIVDSPNFDMCRSQMDIEIDGDWRALTREMEGFHTVVCYDDYLAEVGYALKHVGGIEWQNYSPPR